MGPLKGIGSDLQVCNVVIMNTKPQGDVIKPNTHHIHRRLHWRPPPHRPLRWGWLPAPSGSICGDTSSPSCTPSTQPPRQLCCALQCIVKCMSRSVFHSTVNHLLQRHHSLRRQLHLNRLPCVHTFLTPLVVQQYVQHLVVLVVVVCDCCQLLQL